MQKPRSIRLLQISSALLLFFLTLPAKPAFTTTRTPPVETYEALLQAIHRVTNTVEKNPALNKQQLQVRTVWHTGKLIDAHLLRQGALPLALITRLSKDLNADTPRLYYSLEFYRAYPEAPPALDLPWGYYQYLLAVNDARERKQLAETALREKWNWDKLRAEVKAAAQNNKEFVFTDTPGQTGVYRVFRAQRGPYRGRLVLDIGFSTYYLPEALEIKFKHYDIVRTQCRAGAGTCVFETAPDRQTSLFTYTADVSHVIDGDTLVAVMDLGFGLTTQQTLRLWGVNAPEPNTPQGRTAKKFIEDHLARGPVLIRAMKMDKYGRYLADTWSPSPETGKPLYLNQALIDQGLAIAEKR